MADLRTSYDEAHRDFLAFLVAQGWSTDVRWLCQGRTIIFRRQVWVFRPEELRSDAASRAYYEQARLSGPRNLRLDGFFRLPGLTIAGVSVLEGDSRCLSFGVLVRPPSIRPVRSLLLWRFLRLWRRLRPWPDYFDHDELPPGA